MSEKRKYALSIAGFDPSGGAGLLADIKTFEQHNVYGLGICTANTLQTENRFYSVQWTPVSEVLNALEVLLQEYPVTYLKIGIVPSVNYLFTVVSYIQKINPETKICLDPVIKSSTGYDFQETGDAENLRAVLQHTFLLTPNISEAKLLTQLENPDAAASELAQQCNVLLKGGHRDDAPGVDYLYSNSEIIRLNPDAKSVTPKHGSGCVLSAAITANLALGYDLRESCVRAKKYTAQFLQSNSSLLGYHHV